MSFPSRFGKCRPRRWTVALGAVVALSALAFSGCLSAGLATHAIEESQKPAAVILQPDRQEWKGTVRAIDVTFTGDPQLAVDAFKKDQQVETTLRILDGGLEVGTYGLVGSVALMGSMWGIGNAFVIIASLGSRQLQPVDFLPIGAAGFLAGGAVGLGWGAVASAVNAIPAARAEQVKAAVLPALEDFPFRQRMIEHVEAAAARKTALRVVGIPSGEDANPLPEDPDAALEISTLNVALRKVENHLQLFAEVQAHLVERQTGNILASRSLRHAWNTFGRRTPQGGDEPLTAEDINGNLRLLCEDVVDTLLLLEDFPTLYSVGGPTSLVGYSDGLRAKVPRPSLTLFCGWQPAIVDSLQPRLEWIPFPSTRDQEMDKRERLRGIGQVVYDIKVWRLGEGNGRVPELVYEREDLGVPFHVLQDPLEHGKTYYWAVRARFVRDGHPGATRWTTYPALLPLVRKESISNNLGWLQFSFSTPALPKRTAP
jgi:hypothetical protein